MDVALFLLSRYFWFALGVGLVWSLRASIAAPGVAGAVTPFASAPTETRPPPVATPALAPPPPPPPLPAPAPWPALERYADGPTVLREIRPGCQRDAVRESAAHHTRVRLPRELVDWMLESPSGAHMRSVSVLPEERFGVVVGVRLLRAPVGSALHRLGFEAGDVLETINGLPLATPNQALEAYARLRSASTYVVVVERAGAAHVLYFSIC